MAMALEKLTAEMKVFLGSLLCGIIEDGKIREPNRSSFKNILSHIEARGYDVSDYRNGVENCSNFKNLIRTTGANISLKTRNLGHQIIRAYKYLERQYTGYEGTGAGIQA